MNTLRNLSFLAVLMLQVIDCFGEEFNGDTNAKDLIAGFNVALSDITDVELVDSYTPCFDIEHKPLPRDKHPARLRIRINHLRSLDWYVYRAAHHNPKREYAEDVGISLIGATFRIHGTDNPNEFQPKPPVSFFIWFKSFPEAMGFFEKLKKLRDQQ